MAPVRTKAVNLEAVLKTLMKSLAMLRYIINQGNHNFKGPWILVGKFGIFLFPRTCHLQLATGHYTIWLSHVFRVGTAQKHFLIGAWPH